MHLRPFAAALRIPVSGQGLRTPGRCLISAASANPASPLFEQPVSSQLTGQDLAAWRAKTQQQLRASSAQYQDPSSGPTVPELLVTSVVHCMVRCQCTLRSLIQLNMQRELDWVIDDACADPQWKLSLGVQAATLPMRCSAAELAALWQKRIVQR